MSITFDDILTNKFIKFFMNFISKLIAIYIIDIFGDKIALKIDKLMIKDNKKTNTTMIIYWTALIILFTAQFVSLKYFAKLGNIEAILSAIISLFQRRYSSIFSMQ